MHEFFASLGAAIRPILAKGSHGSRNSAMAIRKPSTAKFDGRPGIQGSAVSNPGEELLALRNLQGVPPYPDWKERRKIGRASGGARVWQDAEISEVGVL